MVSKTEELADNGKYTLQGIADLEEWLPQAVEAFETGSGGTIYLMWEYETNGTTIGVTTMVKNFEDTENVMYVYLREVE